MYESVWLHIAKLLIELRNKWHKLICKITLTDLHAWRIIQVEVIRIWPEIGSHLVMQICLFPALCVDMYVYVCVCVCIYMYIYTHTYIYIYMCMCVCVCVYLHTFVCVCTCVYMFIIFFYIVCVFVYMYLCVCM